MIQTPLVQALDDELGRQRRTSARVAVITARAGHDAMWCAATEARLARLGIERPAPRVADPLLVAATGSAGAVYRLPRTPEPYPADIAPLRDTAARAWNTTQPVALRSLPLVTGDVGWAPPPGGLVLLGGPVAPVVDGDSFGLSFVLAHASRGMNLPIPPHIAASAVVRDDGTLGPVTGLAEKIQALGDHAPGVRVLLVAEGQDLPTELTARLADARITARAHATVETALFDVFPDAELNAWAERWTTQPDMARRIARGMFRDLVDPQPYRIPFRAYLKTAERLLGIPGVPDQVRWEAAVVRAIAARKAKAASVVMPPEPPGQTLPRHLRLMLLAHHIQAANDSCASDWEPLVTRALAQIHTGADAYKGDLMVMGAAARCYGAWGRWAEARSWLHRAVEGWFALDQHPDASFALSEWVRIEGLGAVDLRAVEPYVREFEADTRVLDDARGYLGLALFRACIIQGRRAEAEAILTRTPPSVWGAVPLIGPSLARWCARAGLPCPLSAQGKPVFDILQRIEAGDSDAEALLETPDRERWQRCKQIEPAGGVRRWLDLVPY